RARLGVLCFEGLDSLVVAGLLHQNVVAFHSTSRLYPEDVERRESDRHSHRPVADVRIPALAVVETPVDPGARATAEDRRLNVEPGKVRVVQDALSGLRRPQ